MGPGCGDVNTQRRVGGSRLKDLAEIPTLITLALHLLVATSASYAIS